jgi:hypothetical protein
MSKNVSVRVRMYRQGLGDCFLLTFTQEDGSVHNMMIDCGLFQGTSNGSKIMKGVADDIKAATNSQIDVVALTHEHWDHISGFSYAKDIFQKPGFRFEEVWVGWTENKDDPKFKAVRERFEMKLQGLRSALKQMDSSGMNGALKETVNALVNEFFGQGDQVASLTGAETWKYVLEKSIAQPPKYCSPGQIHTLNGVDGVRIYVLGPPEDFELLDDEESPEDETYRKHLRMAVGDSFLAAATGDDDSDFDTDTYLPFDEKFSIPYDLANAGLADTDPELAAFFREQYGFDDKANDAWRRIDDDWLALAGDLALNIDGITNNTCLAIAIELIESKKVLIFPGDAQFGNWISWQKVKWEVEDENGVKVEVKANDLLKRTAFYKVGHHGSHNATLKKSGLEIMEHPDLVAMIPTNQAFAKTKNADTGGWKMPEQELMDRLEIKARGRVILADEAGTAGDEKRQLIDRCNKLSLSQTESTKFLDSVTFGGSFVRDPAVSPTPEPLYVEFTMSG